MHLTLVSKKLITGIAAATFVAFALSGLFYSENLPENTNKTLLVTHSLSHDKKQDGIVIDSMTNVTKMVSFEPHNSVSYTGYVAGVGYASYEFYALKDQRFKASLRPQEDKIFELILFGGTETQVVNSAKELVIPANGFYELRVLFRSNIEAQQEKKPTNYKALPQAYNLNLQLLPAAGMPVSG